MIKQLAISHTVAMLIIVFAIAAPFCVFAQNVAFEVKGALTEETVVSDYVQVFEDTTRLLTIDQVTSAEYQNRFHRNSIEPKSKFHSQYGVAWGRFRIRNTSNKVVKCLILGNWAKATLYRKLEGGGYSAEYSGYNVPMDFKTFKTASASYMVEFSAQEDAQFYFRYENPNFKTFNPVHVVTLRPLTTFYNQREQAFMLFMGFAGLELMMVVYALALFFVFRDTNYLWLCVAIIGNLLYFLQNSGMAAYIFTTDPLFSIFAVYGVSAVFIPLMLVAQFHFLSSFLNMRKQLPVTHNLLQILIYVVAACTPICFLLARPSLGITYTNIGAIVGTTLIIYVVTRIALKGDPLAKLMLVSQGTLAVSVVIATIMNLGGLRGLPVTANSLLMMGYLSQSMLWTFAVIYKLVLLRKEKDKAQYDAITALQTNEKLTREQNITLESKVKARTQELVEKNNIISEEKERSDALLLNILPSEVAEELKQNGVAAAKHFDNVTVLFTDFKEFAIVSEQLTPQELVDELHNCFTVFDSIIGKYKIEKIKTIGDAYLAVCGLPLADPLHAQNVVKAAIEIRNFMLERRRVMGEKTFEIRIGINSGSVVAGIVGVKKFAYDIWGDTVNTAARMEQNCEPGKINVSESTYLQVRDLFICEYRGEIEAKNKGKLKMYFVEEFSNVK